MTSPSRIFLEQYKQAAGEGCLVELKLRLLADKVPALRQYAHARNLEDVENRVAEHFAAHLLDDDRQTLTRCRQLRNKILHCDFYAAQGKLRQLGAEVPSGGVKQIDIEGMSGTEMIERVEAATAGEPDSFRYVSSASSTAEMRVFGWLLEMGASGSFSKAIGQFQEAVQLIDRLIPLVDSMVAEPT